MSEGFRIPYHDADGYLRHYRPDFVVKTADGFRLIETKGTGWDRQVDTDFYRFQSLPFKQLLDAVEQPALPARPHASDVPFLSP